MKKLTPEEILPPEEYETVRSQKRAEIAKVKMLRRVAVGPHATFYFENRDTMWYQVHEMVRIEKGGDAQVAEELEAYNPLIPDGSELVATVMFEIDNADLRARVLATLGGVEETMSIEVDGETVSGIPEADIDRTTAAGKASSVQFVHFPFTAAQIEKFKTPGAKIMLAIGHPSYAHQAGFTEETRAALAQDFD